MKKLLITFISALSLSGAYAQITEDATTAVKNMGVGWNLGNTLDASNGGGKDFNQTTYWGKQGVDSETCWGQPVTSPALMKMMKGAGFGAIRVPVTWYNHMDKSGKVDAAWMKRVHEVVDYVVGNGMYCILNVHHDTGADNSSHASWIKADEANYNTNKARYENLWKQIAEEFKDYDKHLLFESYNEMLDVKSSWCFASFAASGQYDASIAASAYKGLNSYAQSFVDVVRASGGNNATRNLVVNTYAAANGYGTWNSRLKEPLTKMNLPKDEVEGHLIFEVHDYPAISEEKNGTVVNRTLASIKQQVDGTISGLKNYLVSKGAPVIIGEWGTSNVDSGAGKTDYDVRRSLMLQFAEYYVQKCKENGIATFYWMGLTDGQFRSMPAFSQADLAEQIVKAYHGSDFNGEFPDVNDMASIVAFEGDKLIGWGQGITLPANLFKTMGASVQLELTYKQEGSGDAIQLFYGDWSVKPNFIVDGKTYAGDMNPRFVYGTPTGTEHKTIITFDAATYTKLTQKGLIVHGDQVRLYKAALVNPTTDIQSVRNKGLEDNVYYTISGQRITVPQHGIYIKNGKKFFVK